MAADRLDLVHSLFSILNDSKADHPDFILAKYFLENYSKLGELNIYDAADRCFVSRSSVRRFCQRLGYDNFKDLKEEFKRFNYQYNYFLQFAMRPDFESWMQNELEEMVQEFECSSVKENIAQIADKIYESSKIIFLSSYSTLMEVTEFQRPMVLSGKLIRILSERKVHDEFITDMQQNDLLVTVSASGNFAASVHEIIKTIKANKLLITTSRSPEITENYDEVFYLGSKDYTHVKSVCGKYGLMYFFDLLYSTYIQKYGIKV